MYKRNGDINFHPFKGELKGEKVEHKGEFIVGYGEATGHHHRIKVENPNDLEIIKDAQGNYYFKLLSDGVLTHEEHKTIPIKKGIYKKVHEREVDHFLQTTRRVID